MPTGSIRGKWTREWVKIVGQGLGLGPGLGTTVTVVWLLARAGRPLATPAASEVTETSAQLVSHSLVAA